MAFVATVVFRRRFAAGSGRYPSRPIAVGQMAASFRPIAFSGGAAIGSMTFVPTSGSAVTKEAFIINRISVSSAFSASCSVIVCSLPRLDLARRLEKTAIIGNDGPRDAQAVIGDCGDRLISLTVW